MLMIHFYAGFGTKNQSGHFGGRRLPLNRELRRIGSFHQQAFPRDLTLLRYRLESKRFMAFQHHFLLLVHTVDRSP